MNGGELLGRTAAALLADLRAGHIGAAELCQAYLSRIERYDGPGGLNAVAQLDPRAMDAARALDRRGDRSLPLFGLPVLIKDNIDVRGLYTTGGSLALTDNLAVRDAAVTAALRHSGAVILGKTNMTELANYTSGDMPNGFSARGGQVHNAYAAASEPSGSSSGSAVAVSAGLCAAAVGTDTSFSIVGCATVNGVAGLKPPHGALSRRGILPIAHTLDSAGPLARSLGDALLVYGGMRAGGVPAVQAMDPRQLRLAVNVFHREQVSQAQLDRYEALFLRLREVGAAVTELEQPYSPALKVIMRGEFRCDLEAYLRRSPARIKTLAELVDYYEADPVRRMPYGDDVLRAALAAGPKDPVYLAARRERLRLRAALMRQLGPYDACVMTGPTSVMHLAGLPSLALRLGMAEDGTPRGLILYGEEETRLYAAALTIERHCLPVTPPVLTPGLGCGGKGEA